MNYLIKAVLLAFLLYTPNSIANSCSSSFLNPITDISWKCMFPVTIAGIKMGGNQDDDSRNNHTSPICSCKLNSGLRTLGLRTSFWEPSRIIDTVSDPYCLMPLGTTLGGRNKAKLSGSLTRTANSTRAFQQMHYFIFPVWKILDMFWDVPCLKDEGFDVAMLSEIVPTWNNDLMAMIMNPEAVLFGNPVASLACAADSIEALSAMPRNELFWCMGSWGNAYPLAGSITATDYLEANAGLAARGIYFMGRTGLLWESTPDGCSTRLAPIWTKDRYKLQLAAPVRDSSCLPIGRDALLWGAGKHNLNKDNMMWMMFKKNDCCVGLY